MYYLWFRIREGLRWVFRGVDFTKLERDINAMAAPLSAGAGNAVTIVKRVKHAISYLPAELQGKYRDMMARMGHPIKE